MKTWITNSPPPLRGFWPRRAVEYFEGDPMPTEKYSLEHLKDMGYIGIYVDMDKNEYLKYPLVKNKKDYEIECRNNKEKIKQGIE